MAVLEIKSLSPVVFVKHDNGTWQSAATGEQVNVIADVENNTLKVDGIDFFVRVVEPFMVHDEPENFFDFDHYCFEKTPGLLYDNLVAYGDAEGNTTDGQFRKAEYDEASGKAWLQEFGAVQVVESYYRNGITTIGFRQV